MVENEYSKVKVNNEMDYCSVTDMDVKAALDKAFINAIFLLFGFEGSYLLVIYEGKIFLLFKMGETGLLCKTFLRF